MLEIEKKPKILIVDDSPFNRLVITGILEKDYLLEEAYDGSQAILILQNRAEEFSLVLLDTAMPNMDGFDVLRTMKSCGWLDFLPVIMISSNYTPENIELSYQLGASDLIQRPYDERIILHRIANTIALSSKQRDLCNALIDQVIQGNENSEAMFSILSHIVEVRNGESSAHVQNVRYITGMLLEKLLRMTDQYSLSQEDVLLILTASSLHDIGKITVPVKILNKPGRLTDEEFQVMKGHAKVGADMVEPLLRRENANPLFQMTYDICRWHHERYDGQGYPDGLAGDQIPISAQVVSIADVYDALTSERCYKSAHSPDQAMQMILSGQCGQFNPLLLDCLASILDQLKDPAFSNKSAQAEQAETSESSYRKIVNTALIQSHQSGMFSSGKIMQTMSHERRRLMFFFNDSCPAFYYTVLPPVLHLNEAAQQLFEAEESIMDPFRNYNSPVITRIKELLAQATPEHSLISETLELSLHGEPPQRYQCSLQPIWDSDERYTEVVGQLIPLENEGLSASTLEIMERFSKAGGAMTGKEVWYLILALKFMVYNVRLLDPADRHIVELDCSGTLSRSPQFCYEIWGQTHKCDDCISLHCVHDQKKCSKIVFHNGEALYAVSQYIVVDGTPLVLEILIRLTDDMLFDGSGKRLPIRSISDLRRKAYLDPLTNVYNRRFYNVKASAHANVSALAILDVDDFTGIRDKYGRAVRDQVMISIAQTTSRNIGASDALIRYDGDEFVVLFDSISADGLEAALKRLRDDIAALSIDGVKDGPHVSVRIGGAVGPAHPEALMERADLMLHRVKTSIETIGIWR